MAAKTSPVTAQGSPIQRLGEQASSPDEAMTQWENEHLTKQERRSAMQSRQVSMKKVSSRSCSDAMLFGTGKSRTSTAWISVGERSRAQRWQVESALHSGKWRSYKPGNRCGQSRRTAFSMVAVLCIIKDSWTMKDFTRVKRTKRFWRSSSNHSSAVDGLHKLTEIGWIWLGSRLPWLELKAITPLLFLAGLHKAELHRSVQGATRQMRAKEASRQMDLSTPTKS